MGNIISNICITPDGFCSHTNAVVDEEHNEFAVNQIKKADALLFGRVTYQLFECYWPSAAKDNSLSESVSKLAQRIDSIHKIVFSKTLQQVTWNNSTILPSINIDAILKLKKDFERDLLIFGSPTVVAELTRLELIDEYWFTIEPMMAGKGVRLFDNINLDKIQNLKLTGTKMFKSGVVNLFYSNNNSED